MGFLCGLKRFKKNELLPQSFMCTNIMQKYYTEVYDFINTELFGLIGNKSINDLTDLYKDLGLYGEDAEEFLYKFCKHFKLNSNELDIAGCFANEVSSFNLFPKLFFKPSRRIRIKHLVLAVENNSWPEFELIS